MRIIDEVIVHCTATPEGRDFTVEQIDKVHKARGFRKIGYHYVVYRDGSVHRGRAVAEIGAHTSGANRRSIGVCYVGGLSADGKRCVDTRTSAQREALLRLLKELKAEYPLIKSIVGHRDKSPDRNGDGRITPDEYIKACPCFDASAEYKSLL